MNMLKDTDLREALRRNYADTPLLPEEFMDRMRRNRPTHRHRILPLFISGIAVCLFIAFLLWHKVDEAPLVQPEVQQQTAVAEVTPQHEQELQPQQEPQPQLVVAKASKPHKPQQPAAAKQPNLPSVKNDWGKRGDTGCDSDPTKGSESLFATAGKSGGEPDAGESPLLAENLPSITGGDGGGSALPPERQALVDIFLAEEALQVAYMQQAQTEELRAFTAGLQGKKSQTSHLITAF